jgi:hypothetical protein
MGRREKKHSEGRGLEGFREVEVGSKLGFLRTVKILGGVEDFCSKPKNR